MEPIETTASPITPDGVQFKSILAGSFGWMALGLLISAVSSFIVLSSPALVGAILGSTWGFLAAILLEFGIVIYLSRRLSTLDVLNARCLFIAYAILSGATLSIIFIAYQLTSIFTIFVGTAIMFSVLALFGAKTKKDLTKIGQVAYYALIGLIFTMIVNFFIGGTVLELIISWIGVAIFTVLTARDVQRIKTFANSAVTDEDIKKAKIRGALMLYLDFINLFLDLLRIFGRRK